MEPKMKMEQVKSTLLENPLIQDCVIRLREGGDGVSQAVFYLAPGGNWTQEQLAGSIESLLPPDTPYTCVPLTAIPLTSDGDVDEHLLQEVPVLESGIAGEYEEALQSFEGIRKAVVVVRKRAIRPGRLHLSDLLPGSQFATGQDDVSTSQRGRPTPVAEHSAGSVPLALSEGASLKETEGCKTLVATLLRAAQDHQGSAIIHLQEDGAEIIQSYRQLLEEAERVLSGLRAAGLKAGDNVILQCASSRDFLPVFWGCVLGGMVPVPVSIAPRYEPSNATVQKLRHAWDLLGNPLIVASDSLGSLIHSLADAMDLNGLRVQTSGLLLSHEPDREWHKSKPEDPALIMLTSGSTGMAKGVVLTHRNLVCRSAASKQLNGFNQQDVTLNWMPLDHVAGIIYFHLRDVFLGSIQIHVSSGVVLEDILKWLDYIEKYKVTVTFAPNFAFGLVNDAIDKTPGRQWDLSSLRFVLNGAEAIVAATTRRFLELLAPHKLDSKALIPAWGMSETSSGVTYSREFSVDTVSDEDPFVEVGRPIPGFSMRIVDGDNRLLAEGKTGRLQVRGETVTGGYYKAEKANKESFTHDGWLITGDLGMINNGALTITGREKDEIIINGVNYVGAEIEAVTEKIDGVISSFTAACAVRTIGVNTDVLAIFFSPQVTTDDELQALLIEIRQQVAKKIGVAPGYVLPLDPDEIPKTAIGKIQRRQLKQRFESGEFDAIVKQTDLLVENINTIPDWFYKKIWRQNENLTNHALDGAHNALVFRDYSSLGDSLCQDLEEYGWNCFTVEAGSDYARSEDNRFLIDPKNQTHFKRMIGEIIDAGISIDHILYLWSYEPFEGYAGACESADAIPRDIPELLFLVQALQAVQGDNLGVRLLFISNNTQAVYAGDEIACDKAPVVGALKTIPRELPWLTCCQVDLAFGKNGLNRQYILRELKNTRLDAEVAYREGRRLVARLGKIDFNAAKKETLPFRRGGTYLLSGGLGGIGKEVARYLLEEFQANLLLVGRSVLADKSKWKLAQAGNILNDRIDSIRELEKCGGAVVYESADTCDLERVNSVVEKAEREWGKKLDGVIHLAGVFHESALLEETPRGLSAITAPRIQGSWNLHRLLEERGGGLFIGFGSVNGYFGGASISAYAAANSFLDYFQQWQNRHTKVRSWCLDWSMWDEIGMSRGYAAKELSRTRGFIPLNVDLGIKSMIAGLYSGEHHLLIGLDGSNENMRPYMDPPCEPLLELVAYMELQDGVKQIEGQVPLNIMDRYGSSPGCKWRSISEIPRAENGEIDRCLLATMDDMRHDAERKKIAPRTELEQQIVLIWQEMLKIPEIGINESFFTLGGDSIKGAMVMNRLQEKTGVIMHVTSLFDAPTIAEFAVRFGESYANGNRKSDRIIERIAADEEEGKVTSSSIDTIKKACSEEEQLLARVDDLSEEEIETELEKMLEQEHDDSHMHSMQ